MNIIQRIVKNTSALFAGQLIIMVLTVVLSIFLARILGDAIFGQYTFALALAFLFSSFNGVGYNTLLIRDVSRDKTQARRYLGNILIIRLIFSLIIFGLIIITTIAGGYSQDMQIIIYLFCISILIVTLSSVFKTIYRTYEKMEYSAFVTILSNIIKVGLGLIVLYLGYGLLEIAMVYLISSLIEFIVSFLICEKKFVKLELKFDSIFFKKTIKIALALGMLSIFGIIYVRVDTIMLSYFKGDEVVGWYNAAYDLIRGLKPFPHLFMSALFPLISYYYVSSKKALNKFFEKSLRFLLILGLPMSLAITLLGERIILLFYGQQYQNSIIALQILSWDILLVFLYSGLAFFLITADKQNQMVIIAGCTALFNVVLNLLLIPTYSLVGAAIATIAAESFLFIAYIYINFKHITKIPVHKIVIKPIIASILLGFFIYYLINLNFAILVLGGVLLYFGILIILKEFSKEDISLLKNLIKKEKQPE